MKFTRFTALVTAMILGTIPIHASPIAPSTTPPIETHGPQNTLVCTNKSISYVEGQWAAQSLGSDCEAGDALLPTVRRSAVHGGTRVYVCNYSTNTSTACSYDEIMRSQNAIMGKCGVDRSGWRYWPDSMMEYGTLPADEDFCTDVPTANDITGSSEMSA